MQFSYSCYSYIFKYFCVIMPMLPCWDCCPHTSVLTASNTYFWSRGNVLLPFDMRLLCFEEMLSVALHSSTLSSCVPSSKSQFCHVCLEWLFVWEKQLQMLASHSFLACCPFTQRFPGPGRPCWPVMQMLGRDYKDSCECILLLFSFLQTLTG